MDPILKACLAISRDTFPAYTLMVKKPSYQRKEVPQPIKKKAGLISNKDGAQEGKAAGRGLQKKMENDPRKGREDSEIVWAHLNSSDDNAIHLGDSPP